jgi:uncharacterized protein YkwD
MGTEAIGPPVTMQVPGKRQTNPVTLLPWLLAAVLAGGCGGGSDTTLGEQAATQGTAAPLAGAAGGGVTGGTPPGPAPEDGLYHLGPTPQAVVDTCMSDEDKNLLSQVNDARAVSRQCGTDTLPPAPPLAWNCELAAAARGHSQDMADNDFFSHTGSDGLGPGQRITDTGYRWRAYGENIAAGHADVVTVVMAWLDSEGHCRNIMSPAFTELGAASHRNDSSTYGIYWTQDFAAPG